MRSINSISSLIEYKNNYNQLNEENVLLDNILSIKKTNQEWLEIISNLIENRQEKYQLKLINGTRNNIKWNAVLFINDKIDPSNIAPKEASGIIFFAPDLYYEYYLDKSFVLYDAFYQDVNNYLKQEKTLYQLLKNGINSSLYKKEINNLYELLFNEYKNKEKRSKYVRSKKV